MIVPNGAEIVPEFAGISFLEELRVPACAFLSEPTEML